jgi:hypothetical protein
MLEINYTCSLGSLCHSSQILKRNNYKKCSYPFDWIFSNYDIIINCLEDDFNIFLDKSYYNSISETQCGHSKYANNMWWHHNPLINVNDYNYYMRCVDRFRDLLKKQEHKLFITIYVNLSDNYDKNTIINFNNKFSKYTSNYTLLFISHIPDKKQNKHEFTYHDNIHFLELHTLSQSNGVKFSNDNDNIYLDNIIISNYKFD